MTVSAPDAGIAINVPGTWYKVWRGVLEFHGELKRLSMESWQFGFRDLWIAGKGDPYCLFRCKN